MSIRYINSNDLINDVPDYLQNIINNMDCVYIDGIKPNNQHFNLGEHDSDLLDKVAEIFPKSFCTYCNQEACEGGMVGTIQECETIRMIKDVLDGVIEDLKAEEVM